jgi:hypothetical protein
MTERQSVITKTDCIVLHRKMAEAAESILRYMAAECPKTGLNSDFYLSTRLIDLQNKIQEIRNRRNPA